MLAEVSQHLDRCFAVHDKALLSPGGQWAERLPGLRLVRISPSQPLEPTAWLTLGLCTLQPASPLELLMVDPFGDEAVGRMLLPVAAAHVRAPLQTGGVARLEGGWREGSRLDRVVLTLPYCYGPALAQAGTVAIRWCVPVTVTEAAFCEQEGLEALEARLEAARADFTDPMRASVI